ncbi:MAG: biotin/lipoyl-binding protein [Anaerolineales bacterium]|nr:biotin/lipoyl-binding protein [Anaerolineales bacterium]
MSERPLVVWVTINGERFQVEVEDLNQRPIVAHVDGSRFEVDLDQNDPKDDTGSDSLNSEGASHSIPAGTACDVTAPMPGDIVGIHVKVGQVVKMGDPLCILDAMKMKNTIHAPQSGTIAEVCVVEGQSVEYGVILFRFG